MPTIFQREGYAFRIWPNDHNPPHVHVEKGGALLVLLLGTKPEDVTLREVYDMKLGEQRRALELAREAWPMLRAAWKEMHGD